MPSRRARQPSPRPGQKILAARCLEHPWLREDVSFPAEGSSAETLMLAGFRDVRPTTSPSGQTLLDEFLGYDIIAVDNYTRATARAHDRAYTNEQSAEWQVLLRAWWQGVIANAEAPKSNNLFEEFEWLVWDKLPGANTEKQNTYGKWFTADPEVEVVELSTDLGNLLCYVAMRAVQAHRIRARGESRAARAARRAAKRA